MNRKKILISLSLIAAVAAIVIGGTVAFFSDTETSTGNVFNAGAVDLKIGNTSYVLDYNIPGYNSPTGEMVLSQANTWGLDEFEGKLFFNFVDLKPGDIGEDTISIHVNDNDAWVCMAVDITATPENVLTDPEIKAGDLTPDEGELQNYLHFAFWADNGNNVLDADEEIFWMGKAVDLFDGRWQALADSENNVWGVTRHYSSPLNYSATGWAGHSCPQGTVAVGGGVVDNDYPMGAEGLAVDNIGENTYPVYPHYTFGTGETGYVAQNGGTAQTARIYVDCQSNSTSINGGETYFIAKAWCFGELIPVPVVDCGLQGNPITCGTGFICDGAGDYNDAQTDGIEADVSFYAVQSRHNAGFTCDSMNPQPPVIDGVITEGEWDDAVVMEVASNMGEVRAKKMGGYLYVLIDVQDSTDARLGENVKGNDQVGFNINPTDMASWGHPYDIIFQTGADPNAWGGSSSGQTDGWETQWSLENVQQAAFPADLETMTIYDAGQRVSEWKIPLGSVTPTLVGGAIDVGDGNSYAFPVGLDWTNASTFQAL